MIEITDEIKKIKLENEVFENYINKCFDFYIKFNDESWRKEFEDIHTIEFYALGFINIWNDLDFNRGFYDKKPLTEEQKAKTTDCYIAMYNCLIDSRDLDKIYLTLRIWNGGFRGFYKYGVEESETQKQLTEKYNKLFLEDEMKEKAKNYNPKIKKH